ncbi:MAG: peptidase M3, partial [Proteobacteria bacterium]|nr:peptidase M3 [Pseudomonadota bacterium]
MVSRLIPFTAVFLLLLGGCTPSMNPFYEEWDTPFGVLPFETIALEHYAPAFDEGMKRHIAEIDAIATSSEAPTFENTIEPLDRSGPLLSKVSNVFFALNSSVTSDEMQAIAKDVAPKLSKHSDEILLN